MKRITLIFAFTTGFLHAEQAAPKPPAGWQATAIAEGAFQREIVSKSTGRTYIISASVSAPPSTADGYPVIYLLDGHASFPVAAVIQQQWGDRGPSVGIHPGIVVGISHIKTDTDKDPRTEDFTPPSSDLTQTGDLSGSPQGGADRFLEFLETELKPAISSAFPIDEKRQTLFGHSYGGLFTLHVLFSRPESFQRYVAASPSIWWNDRQILLEREAFLKDRLPKLTETDATPQLLITVGDQEQTPLAHHIQQQREDMVRSRRQVDNARDFHALLAAKGFKSSFYLFADENHGSARVPAINHAIRLAFGE